MFWNIWSLQPVDITWVEVLHPMVGKGSANGDAAAIRCLVQSAITFKASTEDIGDIPP